MILYRMIVGIVEIIVGTMVVGITMTVYMMMIWIMEIIVGGIIVCMEIIVMILGGMIVWNTETILGTI